MDNQRLILYFALAAVLFLIYSTWMQDYGRPAPTQPPTVQESSLPAGATAASPAEDVPQIATTPDAATPTQSVADATLAATETPIRVETDVLRVEISPRGGTVSAAWLLDYATVADRLDEPFQLLKPVPPNLFIAQSGLLGKDKSLLPTHEAVFSSAQSLYQLGPNDDSVEVELVWVNEAGVEVRKRYHFERGSYLIRSELSIANATDAPIVARQYNQLQRTELYDPNESKFVKTFTGGVYYSPEDKYKKVDFDAMRKAPLDRAVTDGWIAMMQHYFLGAWIPPRGAQETFYTKVLADSRYIIGKYSQPVTIAPGATHVFENDLFLGPKRQDLLASVAPGLELAVDYGWLTVIAQPIFWVLSKIHWLVGNWGWAIIVLTILIKLAFYKLSETSYKSMANMRQLAPRLQALKDRYGDDKQRLNQAMMEMYKTEKINPLGGCLPILVQIPVFIALYWVLLESVEMRHAPFILWLDNLSAPDPYFILPLVMGVSMFVQMKLNPPPPDPMQAKIMMSLPFVFTVFFAFFPSGLVLYWTVNNLLSIAQQWHITRNIEKEAAAIKHKR
jgi:YidC/Oxa1 family membrane protein insertase